MEIFGGFAVMISIIGFFLAMVWLIMPFVVFTIKGKLDRTLDILAGIDKRLADMETRLAELGTDHTQTLLTPTSQPSSSPVNDNGMPFT
ncbi:MAG: hypothetical protein HXX11_16520 [Desulfuromonadales bacterium]|nr:hypothetical protein [Desulfuromonadales bacterium]